MSNDPQPWRPFRELWGWAKAAALAGVFLSAMGWYRAPQLPSSAPDFTITAVDGSPVHLEALRGQTVVLNFWATWCGPCRVEMPMLASWAASHPDVVVIAVAVDRDPGRVLAYAKDHDLPFTIALDDGQVSKTYDIDSLPTTVVVAPDGEIGGAHAGIITAPQLDLMVW